MYLIFSRGGEVRMCSAIDVIVRPDIDEDDAVGFES